MIDNGLNIWQRLLLRKNKKIAIYNPNRNLSPNSNPSSNPKGNLNPNSNDNLKIKSWWANERSLSALLISLWALSNVTLANKLKHFQFKYVSFNIALILLFKFDAKFVFFASKKKDIAKNIVLKSTSKNILYSCTSNDQLDQLLTRWSMRSFRSLHVAGSTKLI